MNVSETGWDDFERFRTIIRDPPRRFHAASREAQALVLETPPKLTGTRWEALVLATAEHIAILNDQQIPHWCDEPNRFLPIPQVSLGHLLARTDATSFIFIEIPASFPRHGALPDPFDLDERGGEREYVYILDR